MCISKEELNNTLAELKKYEAIAKQAQDIVDTLRTDVKIFMLDTNQDDIWVGDYHITYKDRAGKASFDEALMIANGIDVDAYKKAGNPYKVLNIK